MLKTSDELHILDDDQPKFSTLKGRDIHALASESQIHIPKPPKGCEKPVHMACVRKTRPAATGQGPVAHPVNLDPVSQPLDYPWLQFDDKGMILPHSILGSLEDFRHFLEAKGETELVKRIPTSMRPTPAEAPGRHHSEAVEKGNGISSGHRSPQSNALQHWHTHIAQRRRQQDFLCDLLGRPVENLLMNQADRFRDTQDQREILNQGYRAGPEFWRLPQRYGDEMSGITATLTQTEKGIDIRQQKSGIMHPASQTLDQSAYLQCLEHREVRQDTDVSEPAINGQINIGSGKPSTFARACHGPLLEKEEEETEYKGTKKENLDPLTQSVDALLIPALRFCGQLARWTGNSSTNQGEVGISARLNFEALTGEIASSYLELHNEGSTAIFYSWQQLPVPHSFPNLKSQTKHPHFYFDSSSRVILPGRTQQVEILFKSEGPGIKTELWQLNTHPVLLQGASMQVTLRGVALYQDKTADQRLFLETHLEKIVQEKWCRSIVYEVLQGVCTPERPSSPAELYVTDEQEFVKKNHKLQYVHQPVEDLKKLWQEMHPGRTWDLSVHTLRQAVLSLPKQESAQENSLVQLNSLILQLSEPSQLQLCQLTAAAVGQQLWRKLLDRMAGEAMRLRNLLGLPQRDTWIPDVDMADSMDEKSEKKGGAAAEEERRGARPRLKDENKGEPKSAATDKPVEDIKKKGKRREEAGKRSRETQVKESTNVPVDNISQQPPDDQNIEIVMSIYTRLLHKKVYALIDDLVDNLCDMMDELSEGDQGTHY